MAKNPRFKKLYKQFSSPLFKFIAKHMGASRRETEEVFENTFVAAWKGYGSFRHKSSYFTWLCRIALNKIADYYHDQVHENSRIIVPLIDSITDIDDKQLTPEEAFALKELRGRVNACLDLLPHKKRRLLWFRYWRDLSYEQIGKILGISPRAVEGRLYRAKHDFGEVWIKSTR